ncbi:hypothetical protein C3K47_14525 [Solitalea longa]|uniref:DUF1835 domain-containing protein n=1 Tax=Solitalea longa TaxID=2079460 RepID=A0A2S4ZZ30_9SPHI|nr:DUF1835 domain-containing protein [Solitalea longa]POY35608.1 hypothetical protein C3K47_14525 [Solitalea longa]
MILHVLNGDALLPNFKRCFFDGDVMIWRECLIEGPVSASNEEDFWNQRTNYISTTYQVPEKEYRHQVVEKLYKIAQPFKYKEINLWFEFDLFCQANMVYILHRLNQFDLSHTKINWVQPQQNSAEEFFFGFSNINNQQLKDFFENRIELQTSDLTFGSKVWKAYTINDIATLQQLIQSAPANFKFFDKVFEAHLARLSGDNEINRVERRLLEVIYKGVNSEIDLLHRFWETESIYGFGDLQVVNYINALQAKNWIYGLSLTDAGAIALGLNEAK